VSQSHHQDGDSLVRVIFYIFILLLYSEELSAEVSAEVSAVCRAEEDGGRMTPHGVLEPLSKRIMAPS